MWQRADTTLTHQYFVQKQQPAVGLDLGISLQHVPLTHFKELCACHSLNRLLTAPEP